MDGPGWRVGSRFGPYELRALLGKGGMGEVYEAYDTVKERVVAVKLLPEELAADPVYQVRFRRESQAAARLAEPHIIPIHDWGVIDGVLFIDMRLVPGTDLRTLLREQGPMAPHRAIAIIEQIAAALDAAHADGLVHRDVKPANILVTEADFAYLADFGIAHTEGDAAVTQVGMAVGSYVYMAPERFDVGQVTGRADIYSLACVLHECLTGATPFPQASMSVLIRSHLTEAPPRPSVARPGVPPALDEVIARGMAKDPADRYPTAAAFAQAARGAAGAPPAPAPKFVVHAPDPSRFGHPDATATRNVVVPPETGEFSVIQPPAATEVSLTDFHFTPLPAQEPAEPASASVPVRPFPDAHLYGETEQYPSGQFAAVPEAPVTQKYTAPYGSEPHPYTPPENYTAPERFADPHAYSAPQDDRSDTNGYDRPDYPHQQAYSEPQRYPAPESHSAQNGFSSQQPLPEPHGLAEPSSSGERSRYPDTENHSAPRDFTAQQPFRAFEPQSERRALVEPEPDPDGEAHSAPRGFAAPQSGPESEGFSRSAGSGERQAYSDPENHSAPRGFAVPQSRSESAGFSPSAGPGEREAYSGPENQSVPRGFAVSESAGFSPSAGSGEREPYSAPEAHSAPRGFAKPYPEAEGYPESRGSEVRPPYADSESRGFGAQPYPDGESNSAPRGFAQQQAYSASPDYSNPRGFGDPDYREPQAYSESEGYAAPNHPETQAYSESSYAPAVGRGAAQDLTPAARAYPVEPYDERYPDEPYAPETQRYAQYSAEPQPGYEPQHGSEDVYRPAAQAYSAYSSAPDYDDDRYSPRGGYGPADDSDDPYHPASSRRSIVLPMLVGVLSVVVVAVAGAVGWQMFGGGNSQPAADAPAGSSVVSTTQAVSPGTSAPQSSSAAPTTTGTAVKLPDSAKPCSTGSSTGNYGKSATGSEVTSCQFAEAVRKAYAESASATRTPSSVVATSPVTGRTYTMNCVAQGQLVTCSGGENAVVYVYS
ncbi:protein kinase domain-containing protein [Nocardia goodfellowii]